MQFPRSSSSSSFEHRRRILGGIGGGRQTTENTGKLQAVRLRTATDAVEEVLRVYCRISM